jgi:uncharacterized protein YnzC (UPF0291/DUF896 family)
LSIIKEVTILSYEQDKRLLTEEYLEKYLTELKKKLQNVKVDEKRMND